MNAKSSRKLRKKAYEKALMEYPFHANDAKRFIYTKKVKKDNFAFIPKVDSFKEDLKEIAVCSSYLFDEEIEDLRTLLRLKLGRKNFNKLTKVFTK